MTRGDCRYCRSLTNLEQPSSGVEQKGPAVAALHSEVDGVTHRLHVLHAARLHCQRGCSACCADDLTVFDAEADLIRAHPTPSSSLTGSQRRQEGAHSWRTTGRAASTPRGRTCAERRAFPSGGEEADREGERRPAVELRDICPLNEAGPAVEILAGRRVLDDRSHRGASRAASDRRRRDTLPHPLARSLRGDDVRLSLCADYLSRRGD